MSKIMLFAVMVVVPLGYGQGASRLTHANSIAVAGGPLASAPNSVVSASTIPGIQATLAGVQPGTSSVGDFDNAALLNKVLASGVSKLVIDIQGGLAIGSKLLLSSGQTIECVGSSGLIQLPNMDDVMISNAKGINTPAACQANVPAGTGSADFSVSNQCDSNIAINGCMLNFNSTQSVSNFNHFVSPAQKWIPGLQFLGINGLDIKNNHLWDAPSYAVAADNVSNVKFDNNIIEVPLFGGFPVLGKHTDGFHIDGPADVVEMNGNTTSGADDNFALNANDGYNAGSTDNNASFVTSPGWTSGPITNVTICHNTLVNAYSGIRLLSTTARIDNINICDLKGTFMDMLFQEDHEFYPGFGNFGKVSIDGLDARQAAYSGWNEHVAPIYVQGKYDSLSIKNWNIGPLTQNRVQYYQERTNSGGSSGGLLAFYNVRVNNANGVQNSSALFMINSPISNLFVNGLSLVDAPGNPGTAFGGVFPPDSMTVDWYSQPAGPWRLLAGGFAPTVANGSSFTAAYPFAAPLMFTTFSEGSAGASLAGTAPAITVDGAVWVQDCGSSPAFVAGAGVAASLNPGQPCPTTIDTARTNGTLAYDAQTFPGQVGGKLVLRWTDSSNYIAVKLDPDAGIQVFDVSSGTVTMVCQTFGPLSTNALINVTLYGLAIRLNDRQHNPCIGTLPPKTANLTSTKFGFMQDAGSKPFTLNSILMSN